MSGLQLYASALMVLALVLFVWGRWRHDVVALLILLLAVAGGLVRPGDAFLGFGHPAVITVAAVLLFSHALESTGVIGALARLVSSDQPSLFRQLAMFCVIGAVLSAFVNNVGALAMLMPLTIAAARKHKLPPAALLMPLSFATMLGGMTTLIGTPPNIIVSTYRAQAGGEGFALFDFFPAGAVIALAGLLFLVLIGWRLIPRDRTPAQAFEGVEEYVAELYLSEECELCGQSATQVSARLEEREITLLGIVRGESWTSGASGWISVRAGDVLLVEGAPDAIAGLQGWAGLKLGARPEAGSRLDPSDTALAEIVLRPASPPVGATPEELRMRTRFRVNLLGVSRQGAGHFGALKSFRFESGDVLLLQGMPADLADAISSFDALPLGGRELTIPNRRAAGIAVGAFVAALLAIGIGIAPPAVALAAGVVVLLLTGVLRPRNIYHSLDGAVLVVLAGLLPVGASLQSSGVTDVIGAGLLALASHHSAHLALALVLVITMFLSDVINNAATAVMMAPIAATVATGLGVSADPFLMAVAIGASCAFLTPIGHQNNLLVMGPGGYRFGDYWRVGLPLEIAIVVIATALLPVVWPFLP